MISCKMVARSYFFVTVSDMHTDFFKDKRVTVMGLGLLGRGGGDVAYLAEQGAVVHVVDDAP